MEEKFKGFNPEPQSWDFPICINGWVHKLSGAEFKVLWYILRHTYGWQKNSDKISHSQFKFGIRKKNGEWLDKGTGLSESSLKRAIKGLVDKGFIEKISIKSIKGNWSICEYKPKYEGGVGSKRTEGGVQNEPEGGDQNDTTQSLTIQSLTNNNKGLEADASGNEINSLIALFKEVNPSYQSLFPRLPQRKAMERMIKTHGIDKIKGVLDILPKTNKMKFAPIITTPTALEDKLGILLAFIEKEKNKITKPIIL